jgi:hypothetical protein
MWRQVHGVMLRRIISRDCKELLRCLRARRRVSRWSGPVGVSDVELQLDIR